MLQPVGLECLVHVCMSVIVNVVAFAPANWATAVIDLMFQHCNSLFWAQVDLSALQLFDACDAFLPFAFAAKVQSDDFLHVTMSLI